MACVDDNYGFCTREDVSEMERATGFGDLSSIAMRVLDRMPRPIVMVCGPMTTGGRTLEENMERYYRAVEGLRTTGKNVFCQGAFQEAMVRIADQNGGYKNWAMNQKILEEFYLPLFIMRYFDAFHFLSGWEASQGASWEHAQAIELGIPRVYIPD